ncbi:MAG: hypothetical protein HXY51_18020 [Nitrospirae bacterium]|nr:hypothetical protein [Nitrospirota bacterium]
MAHEKEYSIEPNGESGLQAVVGIQTSTNYLTGKGIEGAVEDVEALIHRYPFHALLIGLSMGYLLSRPWKR